MLEGRQHGKRLLLRPKATKLKFWDGLTRTFSQEKKKKQIMLHKPAANVVHRHEPTIKPFRNKNSFVQVRVTTSDREMIRVMAEKAGMSVTEFVLSRVWGEAVPVAPVPVEAPRLPEPKEIEAVQEAVEPVKMLLPRRDFDRSKPGRYALEKTSEEWAGVANDRDTGQWFLVIQGKAAQEYKDRDACLAALDAMQQA